jgi:acyl transferase domain-containing protein
MANLRQRGQVWEALEKMAGDGHLVYVEMSPHPVLGPAMEEGLRALRLEGTVRSSLRRGEEDRRVLLETLGALYEQGQPVLWQALFADGGRHVALPTYPWQRERFWMTPSRRGAPLKRRLRHPLLGERLDISLEAGVSIWQSDLGLETCALYADHRVGDTVVLPAAAYVETALAAADGGSLEQISFEQLLTLPSEGTRRLELVLGPRFRISSQDSESRWTLHAAGVVTAAPTEPAPALEMAGLQARCTEVIEGADFYQVLAANGLNYGPAFRCVSKIWRRDGEALACLQLPAAVVSDTSQYLVHPALLDACFQTLGAALPVHDDNRPPVPVGIAAGPGVSPLSADFGRCRAEPQFSPVVGGVLPLAFGFAPCQRREGDVFFA